MVAACVTPFGPAVWTYAASLSVDPFVTQRISEWQRTSRTDPAGILFVVSVGRVVGLLVARRRAVRLPMLLWLGVFAAIGLYAIRGVAWWGLALVPVVAALARGRRADGPTRHHRAPAGCSGSTSSSPRSWSPSGSPSSPSGDRSIRRPARPSGC